MNSHFLIAFLVAVIFWASSAQALDSWPRIPDEQRADRAVPKLPNGFTKEQSLCNVRVQGKAFDDSYTVTDPLLSDVKGYLVLVSYWEPVGSRAKTPLVSGEVLVSEARRIMREYYLPFVAPTGNFCKMPFVEVVAKDVNFYTKGFNEKSLRKDVVTIHWTVKAHLEGERKFFTVYRQFFKSGLDDEKMLDLFKKSDVYVIQDSPDQSRVLRDIIRTLIFSNPWGAVLD